MSRRQPRWIEPMKATLTDRYFSDPEWVFEPKLDGIRCLAFKSGKSVRLLSRNQLDLSASYPAIRAAIASQRTDLILDGEIAATEGGRTSFAALQQARKRAVDVAYFVFDVPFLDGSDLRSEPLLARKDALERGLRWAPPLERVEHIVGDGEAFYRSACEQGLEGVIAKRADGPYVGARSKDWLKFKCSYEQEFVVGGFTDPQGARVGFGALLVGYYEDGELRYAGKVGTGYNASTLLSLRARLDRLETPQPAFVDAKVRKRDVHWVRPKLVAQIAFSEWTSDGRLRHPRFLGLRTDKKPNEVVRERPT